MFSLNNLARKGLTKNKYSVKVSMEITLLWKLDSMYCPISNIRHTESQNLNVSHLILQLALCYILRPGDKSRMKM